MTKVSPVIEGGAYPAKAVVGESIPIRATVFREGHDAVNASVVLTDPSGNERIEHMHPTTPLGFDWWTTSVTLETAGAWTFRVEGWSDPWETWVHNAEIKIPAGIDVSLVCTEGKALFTSSAERAEAAGAAQVAALLRGAAKSLDSAQQVEDRLEIVLADDVRAAMLKYGPRELVSPTPEYPIYVDRRAALYSSWYEFFPRSQGAEYDEETDTWKSGTFDSSHERLEAAAAMGFDVVYLPPIHPIGTRLPQGTEQHPDPRPGRSGLAVGHRRRRGRPRRHPSRSRRLRRLRPVRRQGQVARPGGRDGLRPAGLARTIRGSPTIRSGSPSGPTDRSRTRRTRRRSTRTSTRSTSTSTATASTPRSLRIVKLWMSHGVRIFRVDNPHTKPVNFWAWLIGEVRRTDPDVLFLAEAFTKPAMMHALGKAGFQQSYTYFTWRNEKWEITEYMKELTTETDSFFRPSFWVNTPDILPLFLQVGGKPAFTIRAVLAATLSPLWGVYSGYELFENAALAPGREEYLDSEKFQYRPRDWKSTEPGENLNMLLGRLNQIRKEHPALQQLRDLHFHHAPHSDAVVFSKRAGDDVVIVVSSLDPHNIVETELYLDMEALGLTARDVYLVHDEITGQTWRWGQHAFVRLTYDDPAHILTLIRYGSRTTSPGSTAHG